MKKKLQTIKSVIDAVRLAVNYLKDPEVGSWNKFLLVFPLLYILSPVDLISDYPLIGLGWLDDTAVALTVWRYLYTKLKQYNDNNSSADNEQDDQQADYTLKDDEYDIN